MPHVLGKCPRLRFAVLVLALCCLGWPNAVQAQEDAFAERMRRMDLIMRGNSLCAAGDLDGCIAMLAAATLNAEPYFTGIYASVLAKARDNLASAKARQASGASPGTAGQIGPDEPRQPTKSGSKAQGKSGITGKAQGGDKTETRPKGGYATEIAREKKCMDIYDRAYDYYEAKEYQKAAQTYQDVLRHCPDMCGAMNNLGVTYAAGGDNQSALAWFERAFACNPNELSHAANAAAMRKHLGRGN